MLKTIQSRAANATRFRRPKVPLLHAPLIPRLRSLNRGLPCICWFDLEAKRWCYPSSGPWRSRLYAGQDLIGFASFCLSIVCRPHLQYITSIQFPSVWIINPMMHIRRKCRAGVQLWKTRSSWARGLPTWVIRAEKDTQPMLCTVLCKRCSSFEWCMGLAVFAVIDWMSHTLSLHYFRFNLAWSST